MTATVELSGKPSKHHSHEDSSAKPAVGISWEFPPVARRNRIRKAIIQPMEISFRRETMIPATSFFNRGLQIIVARNRRLTKEYFKQDLFVTSSSRHDYKLYGILYQVKSRIDIVSITSAKKIAAQNSARRKKFYRCQVAHFMRSDSSSSALSSLP